MDVESTIRQMIWHYPQLCSGLPLFHWRYLGKTTLTIRDPLAKLTNSRRELLTSP